MKTNKLTMNYQLRKTNPIYELGNTVKLLNYPLATDMHDTNKFTIWSYGRRMI